jgi:hypothetical protein
MNTQPLEKIGIVLVLAFGALLISPLRYALLGLVKHERFFQQRPTSYWLKILKDEDARYRQWAAAALGELGPEPGVVPALIEALDDKDMEVHRLVVIALGTIGPGAKEAVGALREARRKGDVESRELIDGVLAKIAPKPVPESGAGGEP